MISRWYSSFVDQSDCTKSVINLLRLYSLIIIMDISCFDLFLFVQQGERAYSFCGTIEYMAPEVVKGGSRGHDKVCVPLFCKCTLIKYNCTSEIMTQLHAGIDRVLK